MITLILTFIGKLIMASFVGLILVVSANHHNKYSLGWWSWWIFGCLLGGYFVYDYPFGLFLITIFSCFIGSFLSYHFFKEEESVRKDVMYYLSSLVTFLFIIGILSFIF
jgi:hypothetical protein